MYSGQAVTLSEALLTHEDRTECRQKEECLPVLRAQQAESMLVILTTMIDIATCCFLNLYKVCFSRKLFFF